MLVLVSLFWVALAPGATGGTFSYVFTAGNSMEPLYHQGDLVVLRQAEQRVGAGERDVARLEGDMRTSIEAVPGAKLDYIPQNEPHHGSDSVEAQHGKH